MPSPSIRAIRLELAAVAILLAAATLVFWTTRLDLLAGDAFREPCCSWPLAERPPWSLVYRYGVLVGVLLAAAAMVAFTASYWFPARLHGWRRPALFLVLVATLGPGLLVNVVFKDHYGRPRPREVVELGGTEKFLPVWVMGSDPQAKSFPCGHCAIGFYVSAPWLVLRRRRPRLALGFLVGGLAWGLTMGATRMMAGGHFFSDVVWAGGMVWLVALALYPLLRPDEAPAPYVPEDAARRKGQRRLATALGGLALAALTTAALVATPYLSEKSWRRSAAEVAQSPAPRFAVVLDQATVSLEAGADFEAGYAIQAFGFPTSRVGFAFAGLPSPLLFGVLGVFFALIPLVGTAILWVPGVLFLVSQGDYGHAAFLAGWCVLVVGAVDNFLRPMLISGRAEVPTLAVFVGVMGGLSAFGFIGLFLGPIVLGLLVALFRFENEEQESAKQRS